MIEQTSGTPVINLRTTSKDLTNNLLDFQFYVNNDGENVYRYKTTEYDFYKNKKDNPFSNVIDSEGYRETTNPEDVVRLFSLKFGKDGGKYMRAVRDISTQLGVYSNKLFDRSKLTKNNLFPDATPTSNSHIIESRKRIPFENVYSNYLNGQQVITPEEQREITALGHYPPTEDEFRDIIEIS